MRKLCALSQRAYCASNGIVGESGLGKSVTRIAALHLLRDPPSRILADQLELSGVDMLRARRAALAMVRGRIAAIMFQDPMTAFQPVFPFGDQIVETMLAHRDRSEFGGVGGGERPAGTR